MLLVPEQHKKSLQDCLSMAYKSTGNTVEIEGLRRNGEVFPMEISSSISNATDAPMATLILRDISERRAMQNQLIDAEKQASISLVAGSIGHELNNSVNALMGYSELLRVNPEDSALARKCAEIFGTQSEQLKIHANNLLALSKPQKPEMKPVEMNALIDKVTELLVVSGVLKTYAVVRDYTLDLPRVRGDEILLEQVIRNLEINSAHAMEGMGTLTISTKLSEDKSRVEFSIADTGHGISEDRHDQIFLPFYTTKAAGKGTGLGMYIVKQIVEQHKGYIKIDSTTGMGTKITIGLPVA